MIKGYLCGLTLRVIEVGRDRDDGLRDLLSEEGLGCLLHLRQHHGGDLLGRENFALALVHDLHLGLAAVAHHFEGPVLHVALDRVVFEAAADEALRVEHRVLRVHGHLVLGRVPDETLRVRERHVRRRRAVALVVLDDLHLPVLVHADARVCRAQVDTNSWGLRHFLRGRDTWLSYIKCSLYYTSYTTTK